MKRVSIFLLLVSVFIFSGCVVRTYEMTRDRVDQGFSTGNRGYLTGQAPAADESGRKATRTTRVVEFELGSPFRFEKSHKAGAKARAESESRETGSGITGGAASEIAVPETSTGDFEKYTVQKNDTLQKISQKFYGTTRKWTKIYEANKDTLKAPSKVYPGQILNIPFTPEFKKSAEPAKETTAEPTENLK